MLNEVKQVVAGRSDKYMPLEGHFLYASTGAAIFLASKNCEPGLRATMSGGDHLDSPYSRADHVVMALLGEISLWRAVREQYVARAAREPNIARRAKLIGKAAVIAAILAGLASKAESLSVGG